jgi:hypothetical protein
MRDRRLSDRIGTSGDGRRDENPVDARVAALAAERWGVLTIGELRQAGLTQRAIRRRVERGWLHRLYLGVYAVGHANPPWEGRMLAAVKACGPTAVLSGLSAAELCGYYEPGEERLPEITVVGGSVRAHLGIRVHRTAELGDRDRRRVRGIPVTSPARTLLDLAARVDGQSLRSLVRRAQGTRSVNVREICEVIARLGPRKGSRRLARVIAEGPAPTRSVLEDIVLDLIVSGGLAHPDVNKPLFLSGRRVIPDFRWPEQRLIVEADGAAWHAGKVAREDDAERQALLEAHGERLLRVTWEQAVAHPAQTLARVRSAGAPGK